MTRVLALDPGERVGWARADVADDGSWSAMRHGITPLRDMALAVHSALTRATSGENWTSPPGDDPPDYDIVVIEDWRLRANKSREFIGSSFPSVQFIGMVKLCCWLSGTKLVTQGTSVKSTADKTLAKLWPVMHGAVTRPLAHDDAHDLDAIRHLWFWTYKHTDVSAYMANREAA